MRSIRTKSHADTAGAGLATGAAADAASPPPPAASGMTSSDSLTGFAAGALPACPFCF